MARCCLVACGELGLTRFQMKKAWQQVLGLLLQSEWLLASALHSGSNMHHGKPRGPPNVQW